MKRGGPLRRTAGLARGSGLERTPFRSKPRRRSTAGLMIDLVGRSGGICEIQLREVCCGPPTQPCHRIGTKAGGRQRAAGAHHDRMSNVLHGCPCCHSWQTATAANRAHAETDAVGWVLREGADTQARPVLYRGRLVRLFDDGRVVAA